MNTPLKVTLSCFMVSMVALGSFVARAASGQTASEEDRAPVRIMECSVFAREGTKVVQYRAITPSTPGLRYIAIGEEVDAYTLTIQSGDGTDLDGPFGLFQLQQDIGFVQSFASPGFGTHQYQFGVPLRLRAGDVLGWKAGVGSPDEAISFTFQGLEPEADSAR